MSPLLAVRRLVRRIALLACGLMLAGALMPAVAQLLAGDSGQRWAQVCTTQGMRWIAADVAASGAGPTPAQAPTDGTAGAAGLLDHCPFCSLAQHLPALPPSPALVLPAAGGNVLVPERFLQASQTPHAWCTAQPRAPPPRA